MSTSRLKKLPLISQFVTHFSIPYICLHFDIQLRSQLRSHPRERTQTSHFILKLKSNHAPLAPCIILTSSLSQIHLIYFIQLFQREKIYEQYGRPIHRFRTQRSC